ncbi:enediyne biosynthesis protein [Micromonospora endophytica]|nr:enediyne biosynthesis protein [Micromonospora endophytica]
MRSRLLTPSRRDTLLATRGFHTKDQYARELLETVGGTFVTGFGHATYARTPQEAEHLLESVDRPFRGFAYEGAAMGLAILDALRPVRGRGVEQLLAGRGAAHVYMVHVGIGWALARLPRWMWRRVLPTDPLLAWLALDGYGFHQGYFHTQRYVLRQHREHLRWPGDRPQPYAHRAFDQGIGRVLWFVEGADPRRVVTRIEGFHPDRRADLFSGAGLAATYAGGASETELHELWDRAGSHRRAVAQGSAFAAKARVRADLVTPHTHTATSVFCGLSPQHAAAMTDDALRDLPEDGALPAFEQWRRRIAEQFVALGRC